MQTIDKVILDRAVLAVRAMWADFEPQFGMILGSGWSEALSDLQIKARLPFTSINGLGKAGVAGHCGQILRVELNGTEGMVFQGRRHIYEGEGMTPVILPVWLLKQFGVETVLLTNASGGIREDLTPGSLVSVSDHINMMGCNPLVGPHNPVFGDRFPDQTELYDAGLRKRLVECGVTLSGIYVAVHGPSFETPAEIRAFRTMGADLVGMSTVPEAIFANALGMKVAALSCVCNWAAGLGHDRLSHEDVMRTADAAMPKMRTVLKKFVKMGF
jgi:inosine/guanosine/xanthosine phosphorylase family protein